MLTPPLSPPQARRDPLTGHWILVAPERAYRPMTAPVSGLVAARHEPCVFCPGQEHLTPPEHLALRDRGPANGPGWEARVLPNKFPAVRVQDPLAGFGHELDEESRLAHGAHDIVIERPEHQIGIADLEPVRLGRILGLYRDRLLQLRQIPGLVAALVFKNQGPAAGASQEHAHSQILAARMPPPLLELEWSKAREFQDRHGACFFCRLLEDDEASARRRVMATPHFVALCPFAPRFPFETWILPRQHASHFEFAFRDSSTAGESAELTELGGLLKQVLERLDQLLDRPAFNYCLMNGPLADSAPIAGRTEALSYHWRLAIMPRLTGLAGYEVGGGGAINPFPPEWAAALLRGETPAG